MKLLAIQAEMKAIRTICGDYDRLSSLLLAASGPDTFYFKPATEAYRVIVKRLRDNGTTPDWSEIQSDPSISEDTRKILKASKELPAVSREKVMSIITVLDKYRKLRSLVNMAQNVLDNIEDKQVDLDELIENTSTALAKARARGDAKTALHHFGKGNNTTPLLKEMLYGKAKPSIPTGFRAFDDRNGGILLGSLWTIGANTGGGKTTMAVNLLRNMTEFAQEDCCIVPLEMTATQTTDRLMGVLTGIEVNKISQKRLSDGEKKVVKGAYRKYVQTLKGNNTRYTIYEPDEDVTIEEVLLTLKPFGYRVILIDYISLLKGADGDDQWRQLGNIARFAKMFAKTNNCIVVLLCQVSEEGRIRYAQAIAEHSNNAWIWTMPGEESDTSIMEIKQIKARNQQRFGFQLLSHNASMQITDADDVTNEGEDDEEEETSDDKRGTATKKAAKPSGSSNGDDPYLDDINDEEVERDSDTDEEAEDSDDSDDEDDDKPKAKSKRKHFNVQAD